MCRFNLKIYLLLIFSILQFNQVIAQDTFQVFFDFGMSYLKEESKLTINNITNLHHVEDIDSVWFVGMADTSGTNIFNKRLALKRAKNAAEFFSQPPKNAINTRVMSKGEVDEENYETSRRVSIIIHFRQPYNWATDKNLIKDTICYYVASEFLQKAIEIEIGKGDNKKVRIITEYFDASKAGYEPIYYYGWYDKGDNFKRKRVKFKYKITGKLWWRKRRYVAEVPFESYKLYKIFYTGSQPCSNCDVNFITDKKVEVDSFLFIDRNLMKYLQYKKLPWQGKQVKYRVPSEFVNDFANYYESCDTTKKINWEKPKQEGNSKNFYAYATVTGKRNNIPNIVTYKTACRYDNPHLCDSFTCFQCGTRSSGRKYDLTMFSELAFLNNQTLNNYYLGIGMELSGDNFSHRLLINQTLDFQPFLKFQTRLNIFEKYHRYVKPTFGWTSVGRRRSAHFSTTFYLGAQLIVFMKDNSWTYDPYLTAGIEFFNHKRLKVFAQTGILNAYLVLNERDNFIDYANLGINFLVFK